MPTTTNLIKQLEAAPKPARAAAPKRPSRRESASDTDSQPFEQMLQKRTAEPKQSEEKTESKPAAQSAPAKKRTKTDKKSNVADEPTQGTSTAELACTVSDNAIAEDGTESPEPLEAIEEGDTLQAAPQEEGAPSSDAVAQAAAAAAIATGSVLPVESSDLQPAEQVSAIKKPIELAATPKVAVEPGIESASSDKLPVDEESQAITLKALPDVVESDETSVIPDDESIASEKPVVQPQVKRDVAPEAIRAKSDRVAPLGHMPVDNEESTDQQLDNPERHPVKFQGHYEGATSPAGETVETPNVAPAPDSLATPIPSDERSTVSLAQSQVAIPQPTMQATHSSNTATAQAPTPLPAPEAQFALDNHQQIVNSVRANLLPNGGTMQIRLDPPQLGAIQLTVNMRDGVMSAAFETSSAQATHLLSHSLGELRTALEASGIAVDKLHVEQSPKSHQSQQDSPDSRQQQGHAQDSPARRDQQRRELLERMWRRLSEGSDPLDMVA